MTAASPAGALTLRLRPKGGKVAGVEIASSRPQAAALLAGKTPEQALRLVPLLFSLCGGAQTVAAQAALQAAQGGTPDVRRLAGWAATVRREAAAEHLWHLMLAWPPLCGQGMLEREYADCRKRSRHAASEDEYVAVLQDILASTLLGMPPGDWLELGLREWDAWREGSHGLGAALLRAANEASGAPPVLLPRTAAADWLTLEREIGVPAFCAAPTWQDAPHETGALARQYDHALVAPLLAAGCNIAARLAARLVELAQWSCGETGTARDWVDAVRCGDTTGLARVETARGALLHRVRVRDGLIAEYAVVAPTEWNFHPRGAFAREALQISAPDDASALRQARRLALSLDPCVEHEVVMGAAAN